MLRLQPQRDLRGEISLVGAGKAKRTLPFRAQSAGQMNGSAPVGVGAIWRKWKARSSDVDKVSREDELAPVMKSGKKSAMPTPSA